MKLLITFLILMTGVISIYTSRTIVCAKQTVYVAVDKQITYSTVLWDTEMPVYILYGDGL